MLHLLTHTLLNGRDERRGQGLRSDFATELDVGVQWKRLETKAHARILPAPT
jgi:hypothetical protein